MSRLSKQIIIGLIFILVISLLMVSVFYIFKDKSVKVKPIEKPDLENLNLIKVKAIKGNGDNYDLIARVRNPNPNYGAKDFSYSFVFLNQAGESVDEFKGTGYILPLETKYLVIPSVKLKTPQASLKFKINNLEWLELKESFPSFPIFDKDFKFNQSDETSSGPRESRAGEGFASFTGTLLNKGLLSYDEVEVVTLLLDDSNEILTINFTKLSKVASGEHRKFKLIWSEPFEGKPTKFDIQAYGNPF